MKSKCQPFIIDFDPQNEIDQQRCDGDVSKSYRNLIWNRIILLTENITGSHHGEIANQRRPTTAHISQRWNQKVIRQNCDRHSSYCDDCSKISLINKLEPDRNIIIHPDKKI